MNGDLPQGWSEVALPEVAELNMGQSPSSRTYNLGKHGLPFFQGKAEFGSLYPTPSKYCSSPIKIVEPDDIIISVRAPVGPTNLAREKSCIGRGLAGIRPLDGIPSLYLLYYMRSIEDWLAAQGTGSTFTAISKTDLEQLTVRLAPLAEQRRIVAKLELLLGQVDACQQRLDKIPLLLKRFRQAVLAAACSGRLTEDWRGENSSVEHSADTRKYLLDTSVECGTEIHDTPDSWLWTNLNRVCSKITDGEHLTPPVIDCGIPLLSAKDVRENHLDFSDTKFVTDEFAKKSRARCNPEQGDILVVSRGATVGRTCRVQVMDIFCLMGSVLLFKPDARYVLPQIVEFCFKSPSGLADLISRSSSTAQQAIYIKDMRSFALPIPPLAEQQEIVRRVERLFALADNIEQRYKKAQAFIDKLTPSLLAKAFRGALVPQDPNDEPAAVLLGKIKLGKAKPV
jgi:type I restriction enzyme S subunit